MLLSAGAHVALSSWFNFAWVNTAPNGIDGGPLGFLTWTIPAIVGTFACDAITGAGRPRWPGLLAGGAGLMLLGYALSCGTRLFDVPAEIRSAEMPKLADNPVLPQRLDERPFDSLLAEPPFVPPPDWRERHWNYWMMSQRSGSVSYLVFAAGLSLAVFVLFHLVCDRLGWQLGLFRTLGTNALTGYLVHGMMETLVKPHISRDAAWPTVAAGFAICFGITYLVVRVMEKKGIYLRL
jgi:hypothetical protein